MHSVLAIDAGNTRIKWGVHEARAWRSIGSVAITDSAILHEALRASLPADRAIASNVAGPKVEEDIARSCDSAGLALTVIRSLPEQPGVVNGYRDAQQLGPDRWAALVAAHRASPGHKLGVKAGTALTMDTLTAEGRSAGGLN